MSAGNPYCPAHGQTPCSCNNIYGQTTCSVCGATSNLTPGLITQHFENCIMVTQSTPPPLTFTAGEPENSSNNDCICYRFVQEHCQCPGHSSSSLACLGQAHKAPINMMPPAPLDTKIQSFETMEAEIERLNEQIVELLAVNADLLKRNEELENDPTD